MNSLDKAIYLCDSVVQFPTFSEALRYVKSSKGKYEEEDIKETSTGFIINVDTKEVSKMKVYEYKADVYKNYGNKQVFVESIQFTSSSPDKNQARLYKQREIGGNLSLKNVSLVKSYIV